MNAYLGMVNLKLKIRRGFDQKKLYHHAPLPQYRRKTHYLVLKTPAK